MERIHTSYVVTLSDFRKAFYFGMFQRHSKVFRIATVVLIVGVLYGLGALIKLGEPNMIVLFIALAYLIYMVVMFGNAELDIRKYLKNPDNFIGETYDFTLDGNTLVFEVKNRNVHFETKVAKLACVYEISSAFLIYQDACNMHILPHSALGEDRLILRELFSHQIPKRFFSRFLNTKAN